MKLTVLLLAFLVSAALALPQYKRRGRGPRPARPDVGEGKDGLQKGIEACMERAKTCGADKGPEPTTASKRLLREIQDVVDKENEKDCEIEIDNAAKKRSGGSEKEEAIEKVKESCICKEDKETEAERLLRRLLESGSKDKDAKSDDKRNICRKALKEAGMIDSGDDENNNQSDDQRPPADDENNNQSDDQRPPADDENNNQSDDKRPPADDENNNQSDDQEPPTPSDEDEGRADNQGSPQTKRELINLIRKLAHIKK